MKIITSVKQMTEISRENKLKNKRIGFVPTMGALHAGHLSLIRQARRENKLVVVSIFVNSAQFGPKEDFKKYPRNLKVDARLCQDEQVDIIFYPRTLQMYPPGYKTFVTVKGMSDLLCGASRPGHFQGVATVVTKLLNIINPDVSYFGQKDAQQVLIIKRLVEDLNLAVKIKVLPTVRDKNGLALSSRNAYLTDQERKDALVLSQSLELAKKLIAGGEKNSQKIIRRMKALIRKSKSARIDYIAIVDKEGLAPLKKISGDFLIAIAVWIGKTRLIDNLCLRN